MLNQAPTQASTGNALDASQRRAGFTLVELLVATAAMAFVLIYTLGTFTANRNTYVVIENISEAHQNTLAISTLVERDIRNAGYMVPPAAAACGRDFQNAPDILFVSDSDAIRTAENLPISIAGEELAATIGTIPGAWGSPQAMNLSNVIIDQEATYDTDLTPGNDSDFRINAGAIFTDLDDPSKGVACGIVTAVNLGADQITVSLSSNSPWAGTSGTGNNGNWAVIPAHVYRINGNALERDGVVMARNVEDFQLAWFYDLDDDGQVDAGEDIGSGGAEPNLDTSDIGGGGTRADPALLRELRFNLVLRTAEDDPTNPTGAGTGQATENQTAAPGADGRRRRLHTATIRLRNISS